MSYPFSRELSDWEVRELLHYKRRGWSDRELACHYGLTVRTIRRLTRKATDRPEAAEALRADLSAVIA